MFLRYALVLCISTLTSVSYGHNEAPPLGNELCARLLQLDHPSFSSGFLKLQLVQDLLNLRTTGITKPIIVSGSDGTELVKSLNQKLKIVGYTFSLSTSLEGTTLVSLNTGENPDYLDNINAQDLRRYYSDLTNNVFLRYAKPRSIAVINIRGPLNLDPLTVLNDLESPHSVINQTLDLALMLQTKGVVTVINVPDAIRKGMFDTTLRRYNGLDPIQIRHRSLIGEIFQQITSTQD